MSNTDLSSRLSKLSEAKRELLTKYLSGGNSVRMEIPKLMEDEPFKLSSAQQRLWFLDQLIPGNPLYIISVAVKMKGKLDFDMLKKSFNAIIDRHEILRTSFIEEEEDLKQVIHNNWDFEIPIINIDNVNETPIMDTVNSFATTEFQKPFNLEKPPLIRAVLLQVNETEHFLLLSMHHIIADGWSFGLLLKELKVFYDSFLKNIPSPLTKLPIQYVDYAGWQQKQLKSEKHVEQLGYWERKLSGELPILQLPTDMPRRNIQNHIGKAYNFRIPKQLLTKLEEFSRNENATIYMTLLAGFQTLLSRYTGQKDILVGSPIANRNHTEVEELIGLFVNTLVMRTDFSNDISFKELLQQVKMTTLEAYENQDLPFEKLVEKLQPKRISNVSPLFQVMFVLQNSPMPKLEMEGVILQPLEIRNNTAKFDITLNLVQEEEEMVGTIEYNSDLFNEKTISRMSENYIELLSSILNNPEKSVFTLNLLTQTERRTLLKEWNKTEKKLRDDALLHELIEEEVAHSADKIAVKYNSKELTYFELNSKANKLAHYLRKRGVRENVFVGICMDRSIEMIVSLLGILKAGGTYVPLDPMYPKERLNYIMEDSEIKILLTQSHLFPLFTETSIFKLCIDKEWDIMKNEPSINLNRINSSTDPAYMIYTSGSTGRPKGVINSHKGIVNRLLWMQDTYKLDNNDRILQKTPYSFDVSVWEFFWPLISGAKLIIAKPNGHQDVEYLINVIKEEKISVIHFVPSMLQLFLSNPRVEQCKNLRKVICSGEALTYDLQNKFFKKLKAELYNLYGPTEAAIDVTSWKCNVEYDLKTVPIGHPIANTQIYILNEKMQPQPIGVPGELYIGGHNLATGYHNRPNLTKEKFISNPFKPKELLFKTGDLARYRENGEIEYLGRLDFQVKIRGFRIELAEVEFILNQQPNVRESILLLQSDKNEEPMLIAYVVPEKEENFNYKKVKNNLMKYLPEYMLPDIFVELKKFPLLSNGKVNRHELPKQTRNRSLIEGKYVGPRNEKEILISKVWKDILEVEEIGIDDDFFDLGGHSLMATRVVSRIRNEFNVDLSVRYLFEYPTIRELAKQITKSSNNIELLIPRTEMEEGFPLSHTQNRIWFLEQMVSKSSFYTIPLAIRIKGNIDVNILRISIQEVVNRHESFRTIFPIKNGNPVQKVLPNFYVEIMKQDLQSIKLFDKEDVIKQKIFEFVNKPFVLEEGPLFEVGLFRIEQGDQILVLKMHHIISDAWSIGLMIKEIFSNYDLLFAKKFIPNENLPLRYVDFSIWQQTRLKGEENQKQLKYWKEKLDGNLPVLELPSDRPRPPVKTYTGAKHFFKISSDLLRKLEILSKKESVTLFMTTLSAFKTLIYRYTGEKDLLIGTPIANRNFNEIEEIIGNFVNTIVLRTQLKENHNFKDLVYQIKEETLNAYANQDIPFENLVDELKIQRDLSHTPLFQIMFMFQNVPIPDIKMSGLKIESFPIDNKTAKYDLTLSLEAEKDGLMGTFEYNCDIFDDTTIERFVGHYISILEQVAVNPDQSIDKLSILTDSEIKTLDNFNETEVVESPQLLIQEMFEKKVENIPDEIAVIFEEEKITYRDLNNRANCLANYLRKQGVGPEVVVGICLERSVNLVVSLLAILKAGGAYLPLDPTYPATRLEYMVKNGEVPIVITQNKLLTLLPQLESTKTLVLDEINQIEEIQSESNSNLKHLVNENNLIYVIYTSGSTGMPKGVAMEHKVISNLISWQTSISDLSIGNRTVQFTTLSFDVALQEIFSTWCSGGTLVMLTEELRHDFRSLAHFIVNEKIERIFLPFIALQNLIESFSNLEIVPYDLKEVITAGEQLQVTPALKNVFKYLPKSRLHNQYGPSESHIMTSYTLPEDTEDWNSLPPIGKPIYNSKVYILDKNHQRVPIGIPGELYISISIARGYLESPDLTEKSFLSDPFSTNGIEKMYKTGDVARYLPDGNIEYLGRKDNQVKIRGFRIELGEIETEISKYPFVKQVTVIAMPDRLLGKKIIGYIIPKTSELLRIDDLRSFLLKRLPEYMLPTMYVTMEEFPTTPSGKVDRRNLPEPSDMRPELGIEYVSPDSDIEQSVTKIWREILSIDKIGIEDNFFDLGGNSLLMVKLQQKLDEQMHLSIPIIELFKYPTISKFSLYLEKMKFDSTDIEQVEVKQEEERMSNLLEGRDRMKKRLSRRKNQELD